MVGKQLNKNVSNNKYLKTVFSGPPKVKDLNVLDKYNQFTNNKLLKNMEDKARDLESERTSAAPDEGKISKLQTDISDIRQMIDLPANNLKDFGTKYMKSSKYEFDEDAKQALVTLGSITSSLVKGVTLLSENDPVRKNLDAYIAKLETTDPKRAESIKNNYLGETPTKSLSGKIDKWVEESSRVTPDMLDKAQGGLVSTVPFLAASIISGGGPLAMASLEAFGNSGEVYDENRKKGMSIEEASDKAGKNYLTDLIIGYFTDKVSFFGTEDKSFKKAVNGYISEFFQEASQTLNSNYFTGKQLWQGVVESGFIGGFAGGVLSISLPSGESFNVKLKEEGGGFENDIIPQVLLEQEITPQTKPPFTKPESISTVRPGLESATSITSTTETKDPRVESVTSIVDDPQPTQLNEAVKNVQRYIQTPEVKLTDPTLKALEQAKVGVDELKFGEDNTIVLYRDGNVEAGKPNSYSLDKKYGQKAYTLNKDEVILNTNSKKLRDLYNETFDKETAPNMIQGLEAFNGLEAEVIAIPKEIRQAGVVETNAPKAKSAPTPVQPDAKTPVGTGKAKPSRFAQRIQEQMLSDDPARYEFDEKTGKYNTLNLEEDAVRAVEYLEKSPEEAVAVSLGIIEPPKGQTANAVGVATALKAKDEGNYTLYAELINSVSLRSTRMGQEIVSLRGHFNNDSAENYVKRAIDGKMRALAGNLATGAEIGGKKLGYKEKVMKMVDKETTKLKERLAKDQVKIRKAQDIIDALRC